MQAQVLVLENDDRFTANLNTESTIPLIFTSVNFLSCLYVLYSTRQRNGIDTKHQSYFAVSYLIYSVVQIINISINNSSLPRSRILFEILDKFSSAFLTTNLLLTSFLEFITLSKLSSKIDVETGKYDNYMWQGIFLLSLVASIIGINRYEQLELTNRYTLIQSNTRLECYLNSIFICFFIIIAISYFFELRKISRSVICGYMNLNIIRACLFCIIPYLFQWSLILFYNIFKQIGNNELSLNILLIIAVNVGGIGHAISYFIYERKYHSTNFSNNYDFTRSSYGAFSSTGDKMTAIKV